MKVLDIKVLRGPNYWSNKRHKLIVMQLDLEEMEEIPSNKIEGFYERLIQLMPTLYEHHCSEGHEGGFFERVKDGTWMGHIAEHIAIEIQALAGMDCVFGRTRGTGDTGVYNVVFDYTQENAGIYAAKSSIRIVEALIKGEDYALEEDIQALKEIREDDKLGPSTSSIVEEAIKRGIPYMRLNEDSLVQLGYGMYQKRIMATMTSQTSGIGVELAGDKEETKYLLARAGIPVPKGSVCRSEGELLNALDSIGYPVVVKPIDGNHGRGATTNIKTKREAVIAFNLAKNHGYRVIVERMIQGFDFRLLVIDYQLVAAAKRTPAHVTGNGKSTIGQLIKKVNADPRRGFGHENMLTEISVDKMTRHILETRKLTLRSVLPKGKTLYLKTTANLSTGGTATDVTDLVHPYNRFMAERIARIIGLDICGIDIMAQDLEHPVSEIDGAVLEVNAAPGFRMHLDPTEGLARNVGRHAGGVVIAPTRLTDFAPTYCDETGGGLMTQFDMIDVEQAGLVKFDFLGLRTLTIIDNAVKSINQRRTASDELLVDIDTIPLEDPEIYGDLQQAKTTAVFQLESRGMKDLMKKVKPSRFADIIALVALFRPGPMQLADDFMPIGLLNLI